jgi:glycine/D-amino acid oxidase-like deaminating enzyme
MHDYEIIGAGIMGLATAVAVVKQHPMASILVLEKEQDLAPRHRLFPAPLDLDTLTTHRSGPAKAPRHSKF